MAHLALYREFRPKTFDEVVEQQHIVKTLKHQIASGTISHAYLFCGTRGTGKTSIAKIFARAVNCLNPKDGSPCGECAVCKAGSENGSLDIVEIDAASNNRVDEIRDLREKVGYLPTLGKYKVYIIDEVHMLTDSAFNALLKTLEEPPSHIIFILATTEPEKLPATILSRCMRFDFKLVSINGLVKQLEYVFSKTGTKFEQEALQLIAKAGNGSVRDTLSVAEMCKAFSADNITYGSVLDCLGYAGEGTTIQISKAIVERDGGKILEIVDKLYATGKNLNVLLSDVCDFFRNTLTLKLSPNFQLNQPKNIIDAYVEIGNLASEEFLLGSLKKLCDGLAQVKFAGNVRIFCETLLLSLVINETSEIEKLHERVTKLESGMQVGGNEFYVQKTKVAPLVQESSKSQEDIGTTNKVKNDTGFDNPFSNEQSQHIGGVTKNQNAKVIFGDFIKHTRESGEMLLFAGLADIKSVDIEHDSFVFLCASQDAKSLIDEHKQFVLEFLKSKHGISSFETRIFVDKQKALESELSNMLDGKLKIE